MSTRKTCFILFIFVLAIKLVLSFLWQGVTIFPDETCISQVAINFIHNFELKTCIEILNTDFGKTSYLYSVLISPIYLFFQGFEAYQAILVLNSILTSSLIFPLYKIFKKFTKNKLAIAVMSIVILFLPQVAIYEKSLMTETLFTTINIWCFSFYLDSFTQDKKGKRNKIITLLLAVLAIFTRPFGFILLLSIATAEWITNKKNNKTLLFGAISATFLIILLKWPNQIQSLTNKISSLFESQTNLIELGIDFKNQLNSYSITTFVLPVLLTVFLLAEKNKNKLIRKIKFFAIPYLILNFLISLYHMYGHTLEQLPLNYSSRYISNSIVYTIIIGFIYCLSCKKFKFDRKKILITALLIIPLLFLAPYSFNSVSTAELFSFLVREHGSVIKVSPLFKTYFLPASFLIIILFFVDYKKISITLLCAILLSNSIYSLKLGYDFSAQSTGANKLVKYLKDKENSKILYVSNQDQGKRDINYWPLLVLSPSRIDRSEPVKKVTEEMINSIKNVYDFIITTETLDLEKVSSNRNYSLYKLN